MYVKLDVIKKCFLVTISGLKLKALSKFNIDWIFNLTHAVPSFGLLSFFIFFFIQISAGGRSLSQGKGTVNVYNLFV